MPPFRRYYEEPLPVWFPRVGHTAQRAVRATGKWWPLRQTARPLFTVHFHDGSSQSGTYCRNISLANRPAQAQPPCRAADPAVLSVAPRILRRVIKHDARLPGFGLRVPHRKSYVIARVKLLEIVDVDEFDLPSGTELPDTVILLARPTSERLVVNTAADNLTSCWRLLFHARVHQTLGQRVAAGQLGADEVRNRMTRIGDSEFAEVRGVEARGVLDSADGRSGGVHRVRGSLPELRYFADAFLTSYFPAIENIDRIDDLLADDVDAKALFHATRPAGAPAQPARGIRPPRKRPMCCTSRQRRRMPHPRSAPCAGCWTKQRARVCGETSCGRRSCGSPPPRAAMPSKAGWRSEARADMDRLAVRLQAALGFDDDEREDWARLLALLTAPAARGFWTAEARLLYDLQKVCVDHERGVYTFDLPRWIRSGFRAPLKRLLPGQRNVLFSKHLRGAVSRLPAVRVSERVRAGWRPSCKSRCCARKRICAAVSGRRSPPRSIACNCVRRTCPSAWHAKN